MKVPVVCETTSSFKPVAPLALARNADATGSDEICLSQTTGKFIVGESLIFYERSTVAGASIKEIVSFGIDDIKYIRQDNFAS